MKKIIIISLSLVVALGSMAQNERPGHGAARDSQKVRMTAEQKAQQITDRMVKAYDLTSEQRDKLYELNLKSVSPRQNKQGENRKDSLSKRPNRQNKQGEGRKDSLNKRPERQGQAPQAQDGQRRTHGEQAQGNQQGQKNQQANRGGRYLKSLKEILTEDQFKAYCTDKAIERQLTSQNNTNRMSRNAQNGQRQNQGWGQNNQQRGQQGCCCGQQNGQRQMSQSPRQPQNNQCCGQQTGRPQMNQGAGQRSGHEWTPKAGKSNNPKAGKQLTKEQKKAIKAQKKQAKKQKKEAKKQKKEAQKVYK